MKFLENIKNKKLFRISVKNLTEVLHVGVGKLVCCGKSMKLLTEKPKMLEKKKIFL